MPTEPARFRAVPGLDVALTYDVSDPLLETFYAGYDRCFVLEDEKEDLAGFQACLSLNGGMAGDRLRARFGPFREYVAVVRSQDIGGSPVVGGMSFISFVLTGPEIAAGRGAVSTHLSYIYVLPEFRSGGLLRRMVAAVFSIAEAFAEEAGAMDAARGGLVLVFIEQNDPLQMGRAAYALDTERSGLDQMTRIAIWSRLGAAIVDFPYVQPPLSAQQQAERNLVLGVLGADRLQALDPALLLAHLERFFTISVLKGGSCEEQSDARAQLALLRRASEAGDLIPLLRCPPADALQAAMAKHLEGRGPADLRDLLRGPGAGGAP